MRISRKFLITLCGIGVLCGCSEKKIMEIANPASENCVKIGGTLQIAKRGDGGEYGICLFEDNRQCEEWALLQGKCPMGGIKITGYVTPEGIYCALRGGRVLENETVCQLPSGKKCSTQDLYQGKCP